MREGEIWKFKTKRGGPLEPLPYTIQQHKDKSMHVKPQRTDYEMAEGHWQIGPLTPTQHTILYDTHPSHHLQYQPTFSPAPVLPFCCITHNPNLCFSMFFNLFLAFSHCFFNNLWVLDDKLTSFFLISLLLSVSSSSSSMTSILLAWTSLLLLFLYVLLPFLLLLLSPHSILFLSPAFR